MLDTHEPRQQWLVDFRLREGSGRVEQMIVRI
jgi:hypothetical protein